jgi:hypothetical protein
MRLFQEVWGITWEFRTLRAWLWFVLGRILAYALAGYVIYYLIEKYL